MGVGRDCEVGGRGCSVLDYVSDSECRGNVDRLLDFNDRPLLKNNGSISTEQMKTIAQDRYDTFDARRRSAEALNSDAEDLKDLEAIEAKAKQSRKS